MHRGTEIGLAKCKLNFLGMVYPLLSTFLEA